MRIYLVFTDISDFDTCEYLCGVFSSRVKAQEWIDAQNGGDYWIEEQEMDKERN